MSFVLLHGLIRLIERRRFGLERSRVKILCYL
jgi:hypothetical protein